jgi:transposase
MHLSDAQGEVVKPLLQEKTRSDGRGRPWREARAVLNGVLWILRTGARWQDLPREYPPYQTCHRRFQQWVREGRLERILRALAEDLLARGALDLEEAFIDASFSSAKKGAIVLVQRAAEKGPRSWQLPTAMVFLSPSGLAALRRMKADWSKPRSKPVPAKPRRHG